MSRKRFKKSPPPSKRASASANAPESQDSDAVPDEILAEGSGPQEVLEAAPEGVDLNQREELESIAAEMAEKLVADLGTDLEVSVTGVDPEAPEPTAKGKKSKKNRKAAESTDEPAIEMSADAEPPVDAVEMSADGEVSETTDSAEFGDETLSAATSTEGEHVAESSTELDLVSAEGGEIVEVSEGEEGEGAELPTSAGSMDRNTVKQLIEALVFAADKPVTVQRLRQLTRIADVTMIEAMLVEIQSDYEQRGLILTSVSGGWQFRTRPQFSGWVQQLIAGRPVRLSRAQLETLAIIAYRQPITRPEIDDIRGVDSSATLKLLMDRQLIRILGKKEEAGRPMLYGTTKEFLDFFSLGDLRELPTLREYSELTDESRKVVSERLGVPLEATGSGSGGDGNNGGGNDSGGEGGSGDGGGFDPFGGEGGSEPGDGAHAIAADETAIEASSDESSDETAIEASSDDVPEMIEASSDESSEETAIEASSDDVPEMIEAGSDESATTDSLSALASRVLAKSDGESNGSDEVFAASSDDHDDESNASEEALTESSDEMHASDDTDGETFAAGHVRSRADAAPAEDDELASGSQAFAAVSEDQVQAILAEGSESVLAEGLDVESMVGAMATGEDAAADGATDGAGDGMVASSELVSTDDIVDDLPEPTE
ncbi:MAG TPA: SMC-Scp complex subunit ScpB [Kofleriaceae bacterium]